MRRPITIAMAQLVATLAPGSLLQLALISDRTMPCAFAESELAWFRRPINPTRSR